MIVSFKTSLDPDDSARWIEFWTTSSHAHPEQHPWYGMMEQAEGRRPLFVLGEESGAIHALALLSMKPRWSHGRCSVEVLCRRGPVFNDPQAGRELLQAIIQRLTPLWVGSLRVSSDWLYPDAARAEAMLRELGFAPYGTSPRSETGRVDLTVDPDALMATFTSSTRRDIRLAERRGIEVRPVSAPADMLAAHACLAATQRRMALARVSFRQFEAYCQGSAGAGSIGVLLGAFCGDELLGEIAVAYSPHAAYAKMYSVDAGRARRHSNISVGPLLWWHAFLWARERGCDCFDVEGSVSRLDPSDPRYEISNFKRRFSPEPVERLGEFIRVFNPALHQLDRLATRVSTLWKKCVMLACAPKRPRRGHSDIRTLVSPSPTLSSPA